MPLPSDLNINKLISEFSRRYSNEELVADRVLPPIPVGKTTGKYARYDKDNIRTGNLKTLSNDKQEAASVSYNVDTDSFTTELYRLSDIIGILEIEDADAPFEPLRDASDNLMELIGIDKEDRFAGVVFGSANFASGNKTGLASGKFWDQYALSTGANSPARQVHSAIDVVRVKVLRRPNVMVVGAQSHTILLDHPDIRDRIKFVQTLNVANVEMALASIFGVTEYMVVRSVKNIAIEGEADNLVDVVTDKAVLLVRPRFPTVRTISHSAQFRQRLFPNGDRWQAREKMNATVIEVRDMYVFKIVDSNAGYLFDNTKQ